MASYPYRKTSHSCVPKPWNSASSSGRTWAPIKAPTTSPSSSQLSARPVPTPSLESSPSSSTAYDSSVTTTSLQAQNQASNQLTSALSDLDSILGKVPPSQGEGKAVIMSLDTHKEDTDVKLGASSNETNNNNPIKDVEVPKLNAKHVDMLDDLTNQLVKALDTNDVVGWKPSDESPFGICASCGISIDGEASLVGKSHYHPKCFICADCKKPLGTTKYYIIDGKNYCAHCRFKFLEKCAKCGEVIENETVRPKDSGKPYHADCFCCSKCTKPLQGKYFNTENGMFCEDCYSASREKCARCDRAIMESTLKALGQVYHPDCFVCSMCPKSLEGIEFFVTEENKPLCKEDFARFMAKTCEKCDQKITEETLISTTQGSFFHQSCYKERQ